MSQQDLTEYGSQELSLYFFNTEHLYVAMQRFSWSNQLMALASEEFVFTDEQWDELLEDWRDDRGFDDEDMPKEE